MRLPRKGRILVLGVAGVLLLAGIAQAHSVKFPTSLSISASPSGIVEPNTRVTFSGKLSSEKEACRRHSSVSLIKKGEGVVDTTKTDAHGKYKFRVKVNETAEWRVKFSGKVLNAVHPHNHVCRSSKSERIRVQVS